MADEKQLTVAELLARNAKERGTEGTSRRRRRRSVEEGGVSVAELTGNLQKVKATPAQPRHSSVPLDETAPVIPAPKAEDAAAPAKKPVEQPIKAESSEPAAQDTAAQDKAAQEKLGPQKRQPSTEDTRVIKRVEETPVKAENKPAAKADEKKAAAPAAATSETQLKDTTEEKDAKAEAAAVDAARTPATAETADSRETTGELEPVRDEDLDKELDEYSDEEDDEEEEKLNLFSVLILTVVGVVLGAVVFKGFEILWDRFDRLIVAILGVVVTGVMVGLVHALRTNRDGLSMFLAAIVGLVLAFGPLLIVM